jgi:hypothetical protein
MTIELYILSSPSVEIYPGEEMQIELNFEAPTYNETINHNLLLNRDLENQHPIGAITGLKDYIRKNSIIFG